MVAFSVLLVDDEKINLEILSKIIAIHCPHMQIVGQAKTIEKAIEEMVSKKPDIVFLDINMREKKIFDMLDQFDSIDFQIIFASAFPGYYFKASEYNPADFVVKPFSEIAVKDAVEKATKRIMEIQNKQV